MKREYKRCKYCFRSGYGKLLSGKNSADVTWECPVCGGKEVIKN